MTQAAIIWPAEQRLLAAGRGECLFAFAVDASTLEEAGRDGKGQIVYSGPCTIEEAQAFRDLIRTIASRRKGRK
jgi:hypothetical protein